MELFGLFLLSLLAGVVIFAAGAKSGMATEQEIVGRVLAGFHKYDSATLKIIERILASLRDEYCTAYDEAVAEAKKLEKLEKEAF